MFSKKIFGLDISDTSVEAVLIVRPLFGKPRVNQYGRVTLSKGIIDNGVIKKKDALAERIQELLQNAEPRAIRAHRCVVSIPDSQVFLTYFRFPAGLRERDILETVSLKAEDILPFKEKDVYFDFKILSSSRKTQEIIYVAAPVSIIDAYVDVLQLAGLDPVAIDPESMSLSRSVLPSRGNGAHLIADIGSRTAQFSIFHQRHLRVKLSKPLGGKKLTAALARAAHLDQRKAEQFKTKVRMDDVRRKPTIQKALRQYVDTIANEIRQLSQYYHKAYGVSVDTVILAGGTALLKGIAPYLEATLEIPVRVGEPLRHVRAGLHGASLEKRGVLFANAVGLGLRGVSPDPVHAALNLLPVEPRRFWLFPQPHHTSARRRLLAEMTLSVFLISALVLFAGGHVRRWWGHSFSVETGPVHRISATFAEPWPPEPDESSTVTTTPTTSATTSAPIVRRLEINQTEIGYLNVRGGPGTDFPKVDEVTQGEVYDVLDEQAGWYRIDNPPIDPSWVIGDYVTILNDQE